MPPEFQYKVYLPSIADYVRFGELKNHEHLSIIKYNKNNDVEGLSIFLEQLIQNKIMDKSIRLHRIDKMCIILTMIMLCVDSTITLQSTCEATEQDYEIVIDVGDVLNKISNVEYNKTILKSGDVYIYLEYPDQLLVTPTINVKDYIRGVEIHSTMYDFKGLSDTDVDKILSNLPGNVYPRLLKSIEQMKTSHDDVNLLEFKSPYIDDSETTRIDMDLVTNDTFQFILLLLGNDLNGFYELQFTMMSNYHFPPQHFMNCTPVESKIYYNYMKADVDQKNKQAEEARKSNQTPAERIAG